jgi:gliding motility-associated lipoprotein GldD
MKVMKKNKFRILDFRFPPVRPAGWILRKFFLFCLLSIASCLLPSCGGDEDETIAPKPRAYFRLSFPEKEYIPYNATCPFSFDIPVYAKIIQDNSSRAEPCWLNLEFPTLNGKLHLTYHKVNGDIDAYLQQTYELTSKHQIKASGIEEKLVTRDSSKVYGLIYEIGGNAASSIQFFLTDSTKHFIRGALYFNAVPNTDSIAPVVEFVRKDIYHMIETFEWKTDDSSLNFTKAVNKK